MDLKSRERFDKYMKDCGIGSNDLMTEYDKAVLPVAFGAWQTQQLVIDELRHRISRFKNAFNDL